MSFKKYLTILKLVYIALISSLAIISGVSFFVFFSSGAGMPDPIALPKYAILTVAVAALAGWTFTGKLLKKEKDIPLPQRLQSWYNYKVIRAGVLETIGMVGVVGAIVSHDAVYFLAPLFIASILVIVMPSDRRIQIDLELTSDEMDALRALDK